MLRPLHPGAGLGAVEKRIICHVYCLHPVVYTMLCYYMAVNTAISKPIFATCCKYRGMVYLFGDCCVDGHLNIPYRKLFPPAENWTPTVQPVPTKLFRLIIIIITIIITIIIIIIYGPVAWQRPWKKQETTTVPRQRPANNNEVLLEGMFSMWSAPPTEFN
jgi:hypothetical protein